jgi:hypothetical protein
MQRWLSILLGLGAVTVAILLTAQGVSSWRPPHRAVDGGDAEAADAMPAALAVDQSDADPGPSLPLFPTPAEPRRDGGIGFRMPDGSEVPPLPDTAPKQVRFGVVLVTYVGAEQASLTARSKHDAQELAQKLAADARTDFHAAVRRGDDGSADDVGRIQRGVLEPVAEYVLFTLPTAGVSDPIDTPRGYWIAKRIE